ncbi:MAG: calycin-like domain-containing protein [Candidatus Coprenecus sp.]
MKLRKVLFMSIVALCSVACNKGANLPAVEDIAGNYNGYVLASCAYFKNTCSAGEKVVVSKNTDGTAMIAFTSATWGELTISSAQKTANDGVYSLTGNGSIKMEKGDSKNNYDFTVNGTTNAAKDKFSIAFEVPAVMGGLTVTLLPGSAPSTQE